MDITLISVNKSNENRLEEMFQIYVSEMQKFLDQNSRKEKSVSAPEILKKYMGNRPKWPYLIAVEGEIAGFCLLRHYPAEPGTMDIDQYFVFDPFRRKGVGSRSLEKLIDRHSGRWLIRVMKSNTGALKFWQQAVEACVGPDYQCKCERGGMHFIRFDTKDIQTIGQGRAS